MNSPRHNNVLTGDQFMNRSLADILAIVQELKAIYDPIAGKTISTPDLIAAVLKALGVLAAHNVTIAELEALLSAVAPFVALVK
jgi:hypothetical protein